MFGSALVSVALFCFAATGVSGFSVTSSNADVRVKENEAIDLTCSYSADFAPDARVEWKFEDTKGSQTYVIFDGKPTESYSNRVNMHGSNLRFDKVTRKDNGAYDCEVSGNSKFGKKRVKLTVLVPPSIPKCGIPSSVTTGNKVVLTCEDKDGSPPPKYNWYRNGALLPLDPTKNAVFRNLSYTRNADDDNLVFLKVGKQDAGKYFCEAVNDAGPPQRCRVTQMDVHDLNTGGIVAGVIVALLLLVLLVIAIWYANKKGYLPKKSESKPRPNVVYQPPSSYSGDDEDGDFKQKSSFVV